jgi:hypothetical protein
VGGDHAQPPQSVCDSLGLRLWCGGMTWRHMRSWISCRAGCHNRILAASTLFTQAGAPMTSVAGVPVKKRKSFSFFKLCISQVLGSDAEASRLQLVEATARVMRQAFALLGITPLYRI